MSKLVILSGSPIAYGYMTRMKQNIINSCKENGHNIENDLEVCICKKLLTRKHWNVYLYFLIIYVTYKSSHKTAQKLLSY